MGGLACCAASTNRKDDDIAMLNYSGVGGIGKVGSASNRARGISGMRSSRLDVDYSADQIWEVTDSIINTYEEDVKFTRTHLIEIFDRFSGNPKFRSLLEDAEG